MFVAPAHFQRINTPGWTIFDWETANKLLGYLDPERCPYAVFTLPSKSYVQCLGSKRRLTVEARQYDEDGAFLHWVFGRGPLLGRAERLAVSTGAVTVDASQVLTMRDARIIVRGFLESQPLPSRYSRHDTTSRFAISRDA